MRFKTVDRLQVLFLIIFLAMCVGFLFLRPSSESKNANDPQSRCEAKGDWWDAQDRVCAVPMPVSHFTGRPAKP